MIIRNCIAIVILFMFTSIPVNAQLDSDTFIGFKIIELHKSKEDIHIVLGMYANSISSQLKLDSNVKANLVKLQFHGNEFITLSCDDISAVPKSYLFEDNLDGILPYYKMIIGGKNEFKKCENSVLSIEIFNRKFDVRF